MQELLISNPAAPSLGGDEEDRRDSEADNVNEIEGK